MPLLCTHPHPHLYRWGWVLLSQLEIEAGTTQLCHLVWNGVSLENSGSAKLEWCSFARVGCSVFTPAAPWGTATALRNQLASHPRTHMCTHTHTHTVLPSLDLGSPEVPLQCPKSETLVWSQGWWGVSNSNASRAQADQLKEQKGQM